MPHFTNDPVVSVADDTNTPAVQGESRTLRGTGGLGRSQYAVGVLGESEQANGVWGQSKTWMGVYAKSESTCCASFDQSSAVAIGGKVNNKPRTATS
jgi:hypothetical protein